MLVSEVMWTVHKSRVDRILNHRVHLSNLQRLERWCLITLLTLGREAGLFWLV